MECRIVIVAYRDGEEGSVESKTKKVPSPGVSYSRIRGLLEHPVRGGAKERRWGGTGRRLSKEDVVYKANGGGNVISLFNLNNNSNRDEGGVLHANEVVTGGCTIGGDPVQVWV